MTKEEYYKNPKHCPQCNKEISFEKKWNKFCSSSCSATYTQTGVKRPDSHRKAISAGLNRYNLTVSKTKNPKLAKPKVVKAKVVKVKLQPVVKPKKPTNAMIEEKNNFDIAAYKVLYPDVASVIGVYKQTHITKPRVILIVNLVNGKRQTKSYPRAIYEIYIGRVLDFPKETLDHIDSDPMNNAFSNFQILSLSENSKKAHADGVTYKPPKGTKVKYDSSGANNGMAKLSEDAVLRYRKLYTSGTTKNEIIRLSSITRRTVSNFLFGITYKNVGEICVPRPYER